MIDWEELGRLSELPSVATACGPVVEYLRSLLTGWAFVEQTDGFLFAHPAETALDKIRLLFVTHVDEIGGWVLFPRPEGAFETLRIGNRPEAFAGKELQAFRYDVRDGAATVPCRGEVSEDGELLLRGAGLTPLTMLWTFREPFRREGDTFTGKALDPRVTVYCALAAARLLAPRDIGLLFCFAEEISRAPAEKAATFCRRHLTGLQTVVNADVPGLNNIRGVTAEDAAIRFLEGRSLVDPVFSLSLYERLVHRGVEVQLAVAASGSQTGLFVPLARTVSVALPSIGVHQSRVTMSTLGVERCIRLLVAIGEDQVGGE
jgi:putative aminopeptidase FrvX